MVKEREIMIRPGYHEWLLIVDDEISCSLGDLCEFIYDDKYKLTRDEFVEILVDDIKDKSEHEDGYEDYEKLRHPLRTEDEYEQLKRELGNVYDYYL